VARVVEPLLSKHGPWAQTPLSRRKKQPNVGIPRKIAKSQDEHYAVGLSRAASHRSEERTLTETGCDSLLWKHPLCGCTQWRRGWVKEHSLRSLWGHPGCWVWFKW
jgi:hypothetical protein